MTINDIATFGGKAPVPRIALTINAVALAGVIVAGSVTYGRQAHELEALSDNMRNIRAGIEEMRNALTIQKIDSGKIDARIEGISKEVARMQALMDNERSRNERLRQ